MQNGIERGIPYCHAVSEGDKIIVDDATAAFERHSSNAVEPGSRAYLVTGSITATPDHSKSIIIKVLSTAAKVIFHRQQSTAPCVLVQAADQANALRDPIIRSHVVGAQTVVNDHCRACKGYVNASVKRIS